jgi:hypothetical protein
VGDSVVLGESIKNLGVRPLGGSSSSCPDTSVGTPRRAPDSGFSPAFTVTDGHHAWSNASTALVFIISILSASFDTRMLLRRVPRQKIREFHKPILQFRGFHSLPS